jgi:hypothetical protein
MVRAILIGLFLSTPVMAATILDYNKGKDKYSSWIAACEYTPYSCIDVDLPKVTYKALREGLYGYYDGSDTIYIRQGLMGMTRKEVLMHEMVHYLQVQKGGLEIPGYAEPICRAENEAFTVVDEWLIDKGYRHMVVGPTWWRPYKHCYPWYNPKWEDMKSWWTAW